MADIDGLLVRAIDETSADLAVMGAHLPKRLDAIMPASAAKWPPTPMHLFFSSDHNLNSIN